MVPEELDRTFQLGHAEVHRIVGLPRQFLGNELHVQPVERDVE